MTSPAPVAEAPLEYPPEKLHRFLHEMLFMRRFEEKCGEMYTR